MMVFMEQPGMADGTPGDETACQGCGTCCRKGGPTLHAEDVPLFEAGHFVREHCLTLRRGELARDDVAEALVPLEAELVKFRGSRPGLWACQFLRPGERGCSVYAHRPVECRALLCRDTRAIIDLSPRDRVTRADVLRATGAPAAWLDVAEAHEDACGCARSLAPALAVRAAPDDGAACEALLDLVRLDIAYRQIANERADVPPSEMDFLFGRPLFVTASMYGLSVRQNAGGLVVTVEGPLPFEM